MTDEEHDASIFEHEIAELIIATVIEGRTSEYMLDDAGRAKILDAAKAALKTDEAQAMLDTIVDVADFLEDQGGEEAAQTLMDLTEEIERIANAPGAEFEGFDDSDGVELTYGRRAQSVTGRKQTKVAPQVNEEKPAGSLSLQAMIGTKRRV